MPSNIIEECRKIKNSIFSRWPFEKIRFFHLDKHKSWIYLSLRHFLNKVIKWLFIAPKKKLFSHKNFENPCTGWNLAKYWKYSHNHYNWRVSTFYPLHGISKFLLLNNFFLGTIKDSFYDFVQKVSQTWVNPWFMHIEMEKPNFLKRPPWKNWIFDFSTLFYHVRSHGKKFSNLFFP